MRRRIPKLEQLESRSLLTAGVLSPALVPIPVEGVTAEAADISLTVELPHTSDDGGHDCSMVTIILCPHGPNAHGGVEANGEGESTRTIFQTISKDARFVEVAIPDDETGVIQTLQFDAERTWRNRKPGVEDRRRSDVRFHT